MVEGYAVLWRFLTVKPKQWSVLQSFTNYNENITIATSDLGDAIAKSVPFLPKTLELELFISYEKIDCRN